MKRAGPGSCFRLAAMAWAVMFAPLRGDDTLATLGAGGLTPVKTTTIAMESEDLQISARQIEVKYVFRNHSDRDITASIAFPLPDLDGDDVRTRPLVLPSEGPLNFVDFKVTAGGKPVAANVDARICWRQRCHGSNGPGIFQPRLRLKSNTRIVRSQAGRFSTALTTTPCGSRNTVAPRKRWIESGGKSNSTPRLKPE